MYFKLICLTILSFCYGKLTGQYGLQLMTGMNTYPKVESKLLFVPKSGFHASVGPSLWFRLKKRRLEFNPAVLLDYSSQFIDKASEPTLKLNEFGLVVAFPMMLYPMDFGNDCNCPTFNKQGQFFKKGFHFIFYPAAHYFSQNLKNDLSNEKNSSIAYQLGIGAGIDIGLSKKWTLSPSLIISKFFEDHYVIDDLNKFSNEQSDNRFRLDFMIRFMWFAKKKRN